MWLFSKTGFISVVAHRDKPKHLMVRARVMEDLEGFLDRCPTSALKSVKIVTTLDGDYRHRVVVKRKHAAVAIARMVDEIDYDNFKNAVHDDSPRDAAYMAVWTALSRLQPGGPYNMDSSDILAKYGYTGVGKTRWDDTEMFQNLSNPPLTSSGFRSPELALEGAHQVDQGNFDHEDDLYEYCEEYAPDLDPNRFDSWQDCVQAVNDRLAKRSEL